MNKSLTVVLFLILVLIITAGVFFYVGKIKSTPPVASLNLAGGNFESRSVTAGEVTLAAQPQLLTPNGFEFNVQINTHSLDLDLDLLSAARLELVDGPTLTPLSWSGGRGGHHLSGVLKFPSPGRLTKIFRLRVNSPILGGEKVLEWHF